MRRCLDLARRGAGHVAPNPMVGSVLVHEGRVIGEGYHHRYGGPHAEVNCIRSVTPADQALISSSTLYVSLEPCSHYGKTPPCTGLILDSGISAVVIGCSDPFPQVNGRGIGILCKAGVNVITGVLEQECLELNRRFIHVIEQQRPYIVLKWAQTGNGKISSGNAERLFISNPITNRLVHRWRSEEASILVGTNTAMADDPELTNRSWQAPSPLRLVIDRSGRLPRSLKLFDGSVRTVVFTEAASWQESNLEFVQVEPAPDLLPSIIRWLTGENIQSVLVEGGAVTLQSFIDSGCWDEARIITNGSLLIQGGVQAPRLSSGVLVREECLEGDLVQYYKRINS